MFLCGAHFAYNLSMRAIPDFEEFQEKRFDPVYQLIFWWFPLECWLFCFDFGMIFKAAIIVHMNPAVLYQKLWFLIWLCLRVQLLNIKSCWEMAGFHLAYKLMKTLCICLERYLISQRDDHWQRQPMPSCKSCWCCDVSILVCSLMSCNKASFITCFVGYAKYHTQRLWLFIHIMTSVIVSEK